MKKVSLIFAFVLIFALSIPQVDFAKWHIIYIMGGSLL